jgi:hypothetical protein
MPKKTGGEGRDRDGRQQEIDHGKVNDSILFSFYNRRVRRSPFNFKTCLFLTVMLGGCASEAHKIVLGNSSTSVFQNARTNFGRYKTFSVCPFDHAAVSSSEPIDAQLMFFLRNQMESKGYVFVAPGKNPDLWVAEKLYPDTERIPDPPDVFDAAAIAVATQSTSSPSWGAYVSPTISAGDFSRVSVFTGRSGPTEIRPAALVMAYDAKTKQLLWHGVGRSESDSQDPRVSGQGAIAAALANFPARKQKEESAERYGAIGIRLQIYTTDGISYQPLVIGFAPKSPARDAGMKAKDRIVSVDGQPLVNLSFAEANGLIRGRPDSIVTLQVARGDQTLGFTIKRSPWSKIWGALDPNG